MMGQHEGEQMDTQRLWQNENAPDAPDDLDRVMARLVSPQAPRSLVPTILAQTTRREASVRRQSWAALWLAYVALLVLVAGSAVLFGQALHGTGTLDYLAFALSDMDLLRHDPGLFRDAVGEHMPWGHVFALLAALVAWACVTVSLLKQLGSTRNAPPTMTGVAS